MKSATYPLVLGTSTLARGVHLVASMTLTKGDKLTSAQRAAVLNAYVHRNTHEHACPMSGGEPTSDAEWLAAHAFYIKRDGTLSTKHKHCEPACLAS